MQAGSALFLNQLNEIYAIKNEGNKIPISKPIKRDIFNNNILNGNAILFVYIIAIIINVVVIIWISKDGFKYGFTKQINGILALMLFLFLFLIFTCLMTIVIARNPGKYSKKVKRLFIKPSHWKNIKDSK